MIHKNLASLAVVLAAAPDAREMAAAPVQKKNEAKPNPFDLIFGAPIFKAPTAAMAKPFKFDNGTVQIVRALAIAELRGTGHYVTFRVITQTTSAGVTDLIVKPPTTGTKFQTKPVFDPGDDAPAARSMNLYCASIIGGYKAWRKNEKNSGKTVAVADDTRPSQTLTADEIADLGL